MKRSTLLIGPRDPVLLRDGRSFNADPGARAFTLPWPLPRTIAGAVRTHVGNHAGFIWDKRQVETAKKIEVHGPLLVARSATGSGWVVHVAAPLDYVALSPPEHDSANEKPYMVLRPWILPDDAGCGWPAEPAPQQLLPLEVTQDGKPDRDAPAFWTIEAVWKWLIAVTKNDTDALARPVGGLNALPTEIRTHVKIDADKGTGEDGMLFGTENLVFPDVPHPGVLKPDAPVLAEEPAKAATSPYRKQPVAEMAIVAAVSNAPDEGWFDGLTFLPLGGERRIATVRTGESVKFDPLDLPPGFDWSQVQGLRLLLVTPALFERGWYPGWLTSDDGPLAGFALVSAATGRPNAISGWDLERGSMNATRSAVPAGSVYFFRLKDEPQGEPKRDQAARAQALESVFTTLREQWWLKPVSDLQQDRIDGYGLMLPGVW